MIIWRCSLEPRRRIRQADLIYCQFSNNLPAQINFLWFYFYYFSMGFFFRFLFIYTDASLLTHSLPPYCSVSTYEKMLFPSQREMHMPFHIPQLIFRYWQRLPTLQSIFTGLDWNSFIHNNNNYFYYWNYYWNYFSYYHHYLHLIVCRVRVLVRVYASVWRFQLNCISFHFSTHARKPYQFFYSILLKIIVLSLTRFYHFENWNISWWWTFCLCSMTTDNNNSNNNSSDSSSYALFFRLSFFGSLSNAETHNSSSSSSSYPPPFHLSIDLATRPHAYRDIRNFYPVMYTHNLDDQDDERRRRHAFSHALRTPLSCCLTYGRILRRWPTTTATKTTTTDKDNDAEMEQSKRRQFPAAGSSKKKTNKKTNQLLLLLLLLRPFDDYWTNYFTNIYMLLVCIMLCPSPTLSRQWHVQIYY